MSSGSWVVLLVADGVRPDTLDAAIARGDLPALAELRSRGAAHSLVSVFPSVTGVAYASMLTGLLPGRMGLPGLRWYDRSRAIPAFLGHARSYVGTRVRKIDADLAADAATIFETTAGRSLGALSMITRGLANRDRIDRGITFSLRVAARHLRGDVAGWLDLERELAERLARRIARDRPRFVFAAFPGVDKAAHAGGAQSPRVIDALCTLDTLAGRIRGDAEKNGTWRGLNLWVVSDHGHAPVERHDELADWLRSLGLGVRAHPWSGPWPADVAVMVSGNAMAHVYLELSRRRRCFWPELQDRWEPLAAAILQRPSVDILALAISPECVEVRARGRGRARITREGEKYSHRPIDGDPLGAGAFEQLCARAALERSAAGPYPDAVVQLADLAPAPRSGDIVLSASPGWDFRGRHEPITHVSSHGALHREHMRVPLLLDTRVAGRPGRIIDLCPSVLQTLGEKLPAGVQGRSFV